MLLTEQGLTVPVSTDSRLLNGTIVTHAGMLVAADGTTQQLAEGDYVSLTGRLIRRSERMEADSVRKLYAYDLKHPGKRRELAKARGQAEEAQARKDLQFRITRLRPGGFPWPPPPYSAQGNLPPEFFDKVHTWGEANDRLRRVLDSHDYRNLRYYALPAQAGFAIVTKYEQITDACVPMSEPARWSLDSAPCPDFSPWCFAHRVLFPTSGHWQAFVFIVTDQPLPASSGEAPTASQTMEWLDNGSNIFPAALKNRSFTAAHYGLVLVYEFERKQGKEVVFCSKSGYQCHTHLVRAGLLP